MLNDTIDLDDSAGLLEADRRGLLQQAATFGARLRAVSDVQNASDAGFFDSEAFRLRDLQPRSIVVIAVGIRSTLAARLINAVFGPVTDVPIVTSSELPSWVGPLDVVVVAGDDAGDLQLVHAVAISTKRGAEVVTTTPIEGPIAEVRGPHMIDFATALGSVAFGDTALSFARHLAGMLATIAALHSCRVSALMPPLLELADSVDAEAQRNSLRNEVFRNDAKTLAVRFSSGAVMWVGATPATAIMAEYASQQFLAIAGRTSAATDLTTAQFVAHQRRFVGVSAQSDIFYDPLIDGPPHSADAPLRTIVIATLAGSRSLDERIAIFEDVAVVMGGVRGTGGHDISSPYDFVDNQRERDGVVATNEGPQDMRFLCELAVRIDQAAVFSMLAA